jgi:hypothetical protein
MSRKEIADGEEVIEVGSILHPKSLAKGCLPHIYEGPVVLDHTRS